MTSHQQQIPTIHAGSLPRFAHIVGRERVLVGTKYGFSIFAGFGAVDEGIDYARLGAIVARAALASDRLRCRS